MHEESVDNVISTLERNWPMAALVVRALREERNELKRALGDCLEGLEGSIGAGFWDSPLGLKMTKLKANQSAASQAMNRKE